MIGQMAIAIALPGRSVTPILLLMDFFLCRFSTFTEEVKKIYISIRSLKFLQNAPSNSVLFSSSFICVAV